MVLSETMQSWGAPTKAVSHTGQALMFFSAISEWMQPLQNVCRHSEMVVAERK